MNSEIEEMALSLFGAKTHRIHLIEEKDYETTTLISVVLTKPDCWKRGQDAEKP